MKLSENILNLRKKNNLSQEQLAEKVNVSRQTISNWELGETSPNPEQLILLSKTLQASIDYLLGNEVNYKNNNKKINYIYLGTMIIGGVIAGIYGNCANRFRYIEILFIVLGGVAIGYGIGLIINGILKNFEWKNSKENDNNKVLNKKM